MRRFASFSPAVVIVLILAAAFAGAQSHALPPPVGGITFNQVIRLTRSGISDESIIAQIKRRPHPFNLSSGEVEQLKNAGVTDAVIDAMTPTPGNGPSSDQPSAETGKVPTIQQAPAGTSAQERYVDQPAAAPSPLAAETRPAAQPATLAPQPPSAVASKPTKSNHGKIRLYVTDRPITEVISMIRAGSEGSATASGSPYRYSASAQESSYAAGIQNDNRGGADPRTLEVSGDILESCHIQNLVVTNNPIMADYVLDFRRQGGKRSTFFVFGGLTGLAISANVKVDHAALYASNGDMIRAAKARTVGGAVKEICAHF